MTDSTDNSLKPCPFCGGELACGRLRMAACRTDSCYMRNFVIDMDDPGSVARWNSRADLAPTPLSAVKVKPLVWEDFDGRGAKASAFYNANYLINLWNGRGQFEVSFSYPGHQTGYDGERWHDTLEAAKAAAQADYAARIMAALEPTPKAARIPDHAAWAARGRWKEAYEALRALSNEDRP